jgi:peroxiredoxin Q/BCP
MKVSLGSQVPFFTSTNQDGNIVSNQSLLGQKYILFFYPKDDSPSCTKEACSMRDQYRQFEKLGYSIFGVSPDNEKKHRKFIDKYEFQYDLLADPLLETINAFGLFGPKKFMGKEIKGVYRTTVIVDDSGEVIHIIDSVKTATHGEQLLDLMQTQKAENQLSSN